MEMRGVVLAAWLCTHEVPAVGDRRQPAPRGPPAERGAAVGLVVPINWVGPRCSSRGRDSALMIRILCRRLQFLVETSSSGDRLMWTMARLLHWAEEVFPPKIAHAHCDLPCGVYDPAQARIEAESVKACQEKFQASEDGIFRQRAVAIKEERAQLVKHHLWVLWTDYFKAEHLQRVPHLHVTFWKATKAAGAAKKSNDPADGQKLLDAIAEVDAAFRATKA